MKSIWQSRQVWGIVLLLVGTISLTASVFAFIRDSLGNATMIAVGSFLLLFLCFFWVIGALVSGPRLLEGNRSLKEEPFAVLTVLVVATLQLGVFIAPLHSRSQTLLYFARDLMATGAIFWISFLCIQYRDK